MMLYLLLCEDEAAAAALAATFSEFAATTHARACVLRVSLDAMSAAEASMPSVPRHMILDGTLDDVGDAYTAWLG